MFTIPTTFCGIRVAHPWSALFMLSRILNDNPDIVRIVELGTGAGGLTLFWGIHMLTRGGKVLTFDIGRPAEEFLDCYNRVNIQFEPRNVFNPESLELARHFISDGRALVYCDNGLKKKEFPMYATILKSNDLIMAHDWQVEIKPEDLDESTLSILELYRQEEFDLHKTRILSMRRV